MEKEESKVKNKQRIIKHLFVFHSYEYICFHTNSFDPLRISYTLWRMIYIHTWINSPPLSSSPRKSCWINFFLCLCQILFSFYQIFFKIQFSHDCTIACFFFIPQYRQWGQDMDAGRIPDGLQDMLEEFGALKKEKHHWTKKNSNDSEITNPLIAFSFYFISIVFLQPYFRLSFTLEVIYYLSIIIVIRVYIYIYGNNSLNGLKSKSCIYIYMEHY